MKLLKEQLMKTSRAYVFDIKRFAIHDGDGLRTTIFFKGCPLRCKWCQNPEGLSTKPRPIYFENSCIHCQLCKKEALENQIEYTDRPVFNLNFTNGFDNLIKICPSGAIRYDSTPYTVEELLDKILADKIFFRENGGVTFSGGEPFLQKDFLIDILKRCKEAGLHTAIESSFYAPLELVKRALPYLDRIYADLKIFDEQDHIRYTKVSNQQILSNIDYMLSSEHKNKVIIRTPLIPDITATKENIEQISKYLYSLNSDVHYELLNYNPLASSKYSLVDMEYELVDAKPLKNEQLQEFYSIVNKNGIKNLLKV